VAETYADAVKENGGRVVMRCKVERIMVDDGKVTGVVTSKGTFKAPIVISNAGIQPTVLKLIGEEHFDRSYVNYVKGLLPSIAMIGVRYFTNKVIIKDVPYGTLFTADTPMTMAKWTKAKTGAIPDEITIWYEVPSNYDPNGAPPGKQVILTGIWAPCDPKRTKKDHQPWWDKIDEMMFKVFPDLPGAIEWKEGYSSRDVSNLTRDQVLPGIGGECIGLGQIVGQAGSQKPSAKTPIQGLFYVGCDAEGTGIGIQQATDSGMKVAAIVQRNHAMRQAAI
jgi:phytoene dehydrogenase-like protein